MIVERLSEDDKFRPVFSMADLVWIVLSIEGCYNHPKTLVPISPEVLKLTSDLYMALAASLYEKKEHE